MMSISYASIRVYPLTKLKCETHKQHTKQQLHNKRILINSNSICSRYLFFDNVATKCKIATFGAQRKKLKKSTNHRLKKSKYGKKSKYCFFPIFFSDTLSRLNGVNEIHERGMEFFFREYLPLSIKNIRTEKRRVACGRCFSIFFSLNQLIRGSYMSHWKSCQLEGFMSSDDDKLRL